MRGHEKLTFPVRSGVFAGRSPSGTNDRSIAGPNPGPPPAARPIEPLRIQDEARTLAGTNVIVSGRFKPHAVRDGNLISGQPVYPGAPAARLMIEALGA